MNWVTQDKPGYTLLHAQQGERLYAVQKKNGTGVWRLFMRRNDSEILRTIFVGVSMQECVEYADSYEAAQ